MYNEEELYNEDDTDDDWEKELAHNLSQTGSTNQVAKMIFLILQIGITMLVTIFLCIGLGYLIDRFLGTKLMVWFIVLGVVSGVNSVYILIRRFIGNERKS